MKLKFIKNSKVILISIIFLTILTITTLSLNTNNFNSNKMETKEIKTQEQIEIKAENIETAILAGGCFWCIEASLEQIDGVITVESGYTGGNTLNPTYEQVLSGRTGHYEAVEVKFDKAKIDYKTILEKFFELFDPTDDTGSFADKGSQYKSAIFYKNENEKRIARTVIKELENSKMYNNPIVTKLIENQTFYIAEEYHQDYYKKAPLRYNAYKKYSGREEYQKELLEKKLETN